MSKKKFNQCGAAEIQKMIDAAVEKEEFLQYVYECKLPHTGRKGRM